MSPLIRGAGLALAAAVVIATGFWLARAGRPYGTLLLNVHKLVDLGAVVFIGWSVYGASRSAPLPGALWAAAAVASVCTIAAFATGGVVSANATAPGWVARMHGVGAWLSVGFSAVTYSLLLTR